MDVNEHEILSNITLDTIQYHSPAQINVNEHEILSNITLRHKLM